MGRGFRGGLFSSPAIYDTEYLCLPERTPLTSAIRLDPILTGASPAPLAPSTVAALPSIEAAGFSLGSGLIQLSRK